jgi:hypothetical protein
MKILIKGYGRENRLGYTALEPKYVPPKHAHKSKGLFDAMAQRTVFIHSRQCEDLKSKSILFIPH